jgi:hypothetical protein
MKKFELRYEKPYSYSPAQSTQDEELHVIKTALIQVSLDSLGSAVKAGEHWINYIHLIRDENVIIIHRYYGPNEEHGYLEARITQENFIEIDEAWRHLIKQRVPGITIKKEHGNFLVEANYDPPPIHKICTILDGPYKENDTEDDIEVEPSDLGDK